MSPSPSEHPRERDGGRDERLRSELRGAVLGTLRGALGGSRSCVIADFPRHLNVGDQAIWLGERAALDELGVAVTGACDRATYRPAVLDRRLGDGALCIHGGGNFGDLYHTHHQLRLRLLHDFRGRRIVQLAQSIHFEDPGALEQTRRAIAAHGDVVIVVRDVHSQRLAATFDADVVLAPDMAFALGSAPVPRAPERPVVRQAREDRERASADRGTDDVDWLVGAVAAGGAPALARAARAARRSPPEPPTAVASSRPHRARPP